MITDKNLLDRPGPTHLPENAGERGGVPPAGREAPAPAEAVAKCPTFFLARAMLADDVFEAGLL
ncbi:hypothetical protein [Streptomyces viridosporus]|uniref:hypothetical protein n=1 Tax=Streptomyces viridosporus TaxID=67581 RepID=UPI001180C4A4|nr:hypothetical protein [Streptomyces viridosporus]